MHYGELKKCDIANGAGVRVTLFVSGCTNRCPGCFQPQTWDFCYGRPFTQETEAEIFSELDKSYVDGLTVLGGEPFEPQNQPVLTALLRRVKARHPTKNVWCFTGFRLGEELLTEGSYPRTEHTDEMLSYIDILVDGRFVQELKDISLQFRGSRNQRIIDLNATRAAGEVVIWEKLRR
ncbi:MAG: anaerobic ribonucleoside-triphosphate reductase activating protein [Ruminococcaceae bacterium]|nr:anaerobic ribonucleoside-triphosphate reductase activating protein [Oscillospiraceae bacterium]